MTEVHTAEEVERLPAGTVLSCPSPRSTTVYHWMWTGSTMVGVDAGHNPYPVDRNYYLPQHVLDKYGPLTVVKR